MADTDYFKVLSDAWTSTGNAVTAAQQQMFKAMAERMSQGVMFPFQPFLMGETSGNAANEAFRQIFSSALQIPEAIGKAAAPNGAADSVTVELLQKILDPKAWLSSAGYMDETVRRIIEGPKLADLGQIENKFFAVMKAWGETRTYSLEYSTLMLSAWTKAASDFSGRLNRAADGRPLASRSELVALWVEVANQHLFELQRSPAYLENQRKLLRASSALKLAQQELSDLYGEMFGLPTRSEIDDLTRTVAELKREFRTDKRQRERTSLRDKHN